MKRTSMLAVALAGTAVVAYALPGIVTTPVSSVVAVVKGATGSVDTAVAALTTESATDTSRAATAGAGVTLSDLIYYGTCWWQFQTVANTTPLPALGNGYRNPHVIYDADGNYFAGTVEKTDADGRVTDIILAFAAAKTATGANALQDITDNALLTYGRGSTQATRAAELYAGLMSNPAYAGARIHVTGLSFGSAFAQYVLGYSIVTYGKGATMARADFVHFGVPGYAQGIATHFGLGIADFDGMITGYTPKNDPTPSNVPPGGLQHGQPDLNAKLMGTMHWMADFQPYGPLPAVAAANGLAAHQSFAYIGAFGLPAWMSAAERQYAIDTILANGPAQTKYDPTYGAGGSVAETIIGDGAANVLTGTASGDALQGRAGADILTGGGGRNGFIYSKVDDSVPTSPDLVTDFKSGDVIDLSGMGRLAGFAFVGAQRPTRPGTVGYRIVGTETLVEINTSGGSTPDMAIRLAGVRALTASDFALGGTLTDAARYLLFQALNTTGDPFVDHAYVGPTLS